MNHGCIISIENNEGRFKCTFFSFRSYVIGFKRRCKPLLFINRTRLLGKYKASCWYNRQNGNKGLFHEAFAIVDNEKDENQTWFLATPKEVFNGDNDYDKIITFARQVQRFVNIIMKVFPSTPHGFCLRHLEMNFMRVKTRLGKALREEFRVIIIKIGYACTAREYIAIVSKLASTSIVAHHWLIHKSNIDHWSNYLFKGACWCEIYSNIAKSFNAQIKEYSSHDQLTIMYNVLFLCVL